MSDEHNDNVTHIHKKPDKGPKVRFPPPLVFAGFIALGLTADALLPLPTFAVYPLFNWLGGGCIAIGIALIIISLGLFGIAKENPEPWTATNVIIARGPYRYTRNPMYLGMAIIMLGIALWRDSAGVLALIPLAVVMIDRFVVIPEERYLETRFGEPYATYKRKVRRWL